MSRQQAMLLSLSMVGSAFLAVIVMTVYLTTDWPNLAIAAVSAVVFYMWQSAIFTLFEDA